MSRDFDVAWKPDPIREARRQMVDAMIEAGQGAFSNPTVQRLSAHVGRLEQELCTSLTLGWLHLDQIVAASAERDMLAVVDPVPQPDLGEFGIEGKFAFEGARDERTPSAAKGAIFAWLAQVPPVPGIARFKLLSGDWWCVIESECQSALAALGDQPALDFGDWDGWDRWIRFLRVAADHGGFIVS